MRRVDDPAELAAAVTAAARESEQAFGDGSVYLERLVEGGRHIEVQLLGDDRARWSPSASATARPSVATRSWSRRRRRPA